MDPRRWREGGRSLGEGKIAPRSKHICLTFWSIQGNCHRTTPVLLRGVFEVTSKRGEGSSDLESLKLKDEAEDEEQTLLDNLFFTFCCGDNLTCLKSNMVRKTSICQLIFFVRYATAHLIVQMVKMRLTVKRNQRRRKSNSTRKRRNFPTI